MSNAERVVGFINADHARKIAAMLEVKFGICVASAPVTHSNDRKLIAFCSPQLAKRMNDYLDGYRDALGI